MCHELSVFSDTSIQTIRLCLVNSPVCPSDRPLLDIQQFLQGHLSSSEDSTRTVAAACLGTLCSRIENEQQLTVLVNSVLLGIYSQLHVFLTTAAVTTTWWGIKLSVWKSGNCRKSVNLSTECIYQLVCYCNFIQP